MKSITKILFPFPLTFPLVLALTFPFPLLTSCHKQAKNNLVETPWGGTVSIDGEAPVTQSTDSAGLGEEIIMLTLYGPETYYEYHGKDMGTNYLLCEKLAEHLRKSVRIDVCRDTTDMLQRLQSGEGDIIAVPLSRKHQQGFITVANNWVVGSSSTQLASLIRSWYKPGMLAQVREQEQYQLSVASVTRRIFPVMLSASKGTISHYDHLFRKYAPVALVDWTLLAAQCYQESCFDPQAHSWAGACGLMQIMPSTADHLSLPRQQIYQPEPNVAAAARYMRELQTLFLDINNPAERIRFALAAYNGGANHVRDAMALAKKYGAIPQRWSDVRRYILLLQDSRYYTDPVVKYGYMRGSETAQYVDNIMQRHSQYRVVLATGAKVKVPVLRQGSGVSVPRETGEPKGVVRPLTSSEPIGGSTASPHRAAKKNKWRKD